LDYLPEEAEMTPLANTVHEIVPQQDTAWDIDAYSIVRRKGKPREPNMMVTKLHPKTDEGKYIRAIKKYKL
jgi:hypothetical protein